MEKTATKKGGNLKGLLGKFRVVGEFQLKTISTSKKVITPASRISINKMPLIKGWVGWGGVRGLTGAPCPASQLTKMVQAPFGLTSGRASTGLPGLYQP